MEVVCIVSLIPAVIMMGTTHPSWDVIGLRMTYLFFFELRLYVGDLSLQYLNPMVLL